MKTLTILFLEDNLLFAETLTEVFLQLGWHITHVTDVQEAKDIFSAQHFDLVISDLHLQDGQTGYPNSGLDLIHHIRQRKKSRIPIVVTTGLELISKEAMLEYDVDLFYYKSRFDVKEFIANIEKLTQV